MIDFDSYWRNFGKLHDEVIKNPRELEEDFKNLCRKIWKDIEIYQGDSHKQGYNEGYDDARMEYKDN